MGGFFALAFEVINFQNQVQFTGQPLLVYYGEHSYPNSPSILGALIHSPWSSNEFTRQAGDTTPISTLQV